MLMVFGSQTSSYLRNAKKKRFYLFLLKTHTRIHTHTHKTDRQLQQKVNLNVYSLTLNKNLSAHVLFFCTLSLTILSFRL